MQLERASIDFVVRCLARLGAPAHDLEDLAQDVIVIALSRQQTFDESRALYPWLWGIARNRLRDHRARARHRFEVARDADAAIESSRDHMLASSLLRGLGELPEEQQVMVMLHDLEAWTMKECAGALGISVDVAKYRLSLARRALKAALTGGPS